MDLLKAAEAEFLKERNVTFGPGDTIKVHVKIKEGDKERTQMFQGTCIQKRGTGTGASFTVRKMTEGVGVERVFPLHSPFVTKIDVVKRGNVHRAKLFYLRQLRGKSARIEEKKKEEEPTALPAKAEAAVA